MRSRKTCRHVAHCSTISICGATTARWIASITRFMWSVGSKADEKPARPLPGIVPHGYDAGKKVEGKKCHILVDTLGLLLHGEIAAKALAGRRRVRSRRATTTYERVRVLLTQPRFQSSQKGRALFLGYAQTLFGAQAVDVALNVEQRVNALDRR